MATDITWNYIDESEENTSITLKFAAIAADGSNWDDVVTDVASDLAVMGTSLGTLTLCNEWKSYVTHIAQKIAKSVPSNKAAQREWVARMVYADDVTGQEYRFDIPGPDPDMFIANTDKVDMSAVAVAAFKVLFDARVLSPAGNAVTLLRGYRSARKG